MYYPHFFYRTSNNKGRPVKYMTTRGRWYTLLLISGTTSPYYPCLR